MAKIRILSPLERKAFQLPPIFSLEEKTQYFEMTDTAKNTLHTMRSSYRKVGFILDWGYFRCSGRFFSPTLYHKRDILFVCQLLNVNPKIVKLERYKKHLLIRNRKEIREILGFKTFDKNKEATRLLSQEISSLVEKQIRPKAIIYYLSQFFFHRKIETPSYQQMAESILTAIEHFDTRLLNTLATHLTQQHRELLDPLLPNIEQRLEKNEIIKNSKKIKSNKKNKKGKRGKKEDDQLSWVTLRDISISTKPNKIKQSVQDFLQIKNLFSQIQDVIQALALTPQSIKYYAIWIQKARKSQVTKIKNSYKRYLYLIAFITHQYYYRQDLLVDTFLQIIHSVLNTLEKQQQQEDKQRRKEREHATQLLSSSYQDKTELLTKIQTILNEEQLSAEEKIQQIKQWMNTEAAVDPEITVCIEKLDKQIRNSLNDADFYNTLEQQSSTLQKRLSLLLKHLDLHAFQTPSSLFNAILHFKTQENLSATQLPIDFLGPKELAHLYDDQIEKIKKTEKTEKTASDEKDKIRYSLYKALLFVKTAEAIRSGELNLRYSYRYLSVNEYLIPKSLWEKDRETYVQRAGLTAYLSVKETIERLQKKLDEQYHRVNESINSGKNPYVSFNKLDEIIVETPKVEKIETLRIAELLKQHQKNYISILDLLTTVDQLTHFSECLQHYSVVQKIKRPDPIVFYAGLMAKGCNIGLQKLASVSKGVSGHTLETVVNWYFTNDHLMAANQRIIQLINKLELPNLMKRTQGKLHTSSDGQKRNVDVDSILANFSFKYHGSGRGVSIYDFIDERHVLFHSLVMSSAEREAAYVIDGLLCNDEIKSDIHSTDTHGYSDIIFAITHLLDISFAPRLAKLKKRTLYGFESRKSYQKKGFRVLPDHKINLQLIEDNWDDILRVVASLKLKESTASQILKRLSSYAKENPLYQGLKEFGKLIKTIFILTYIDDLGLRQAIQKQLNKIELANKFSSAVFFDNNQEFKEGTREEQEIATNCKILLQNSIVLWNYLFLTQLLVKTEDPLKHAELLKIIQNGSIMTWLHINMLGEYDFTRRAASNESYFDMNSILAWSA